MPISTLASTLRLMLPLALPATAPSVAGKWLATFGNGRPPTLHRFPDLVPTPMKTIRSHRLDGERSCGADAGRPAHELPGPSTEISSRPTAMTSFRDSGPAPFRAWLAERCGGSCAGRHLVADTAPLTRFAQARLYHSEVKGLDLAARRVLCHDRPPVPYAGLSINIGSTPSARHIPGMAERLPRALRGKPRPQYDKTSPHFRRAACGDR